MKPLMSQKRTWGLLAATTLGLLGYIAWSQTSSVPRSSAKGFLVQRTDPSPADPQLCIAVISCDRPDLLRPTLYRVIDHMEKYETMPYELVWVDQASDPSTRQKFAQQYQFNKRLVVDRARGFGWPFNMAYFGLCRAPYVLILEEDWEAIKGVEEGLREPKFVQEAMEILANYHNKSLYGVMLRSAPEDRVYTSGPFKVTTSLGVSEVVERRSNVPKTHNYTYTNGATVYDRAKLQDIGYFNEKVKDAEWDYGVRAYNMGYFLGSVWRKSSCKPEDSTCNRVVDHTGKWSSTHKKNLFGKKVCTGTVWG
eukprot:m51a1_g4008 hypothetical protein (309) ;mRNA; r:551382-552401